MPDGRVIGVEKVINNGPDRLRWNLVVIGDGYRASEIPKFRADLCKVMAEFHRTAPFSSYLSDRVNVHAIDVASTESGAKDPTACGGTGANPRTYFGATFCSTGPGGVRIERLLTVNTTLALQVARQRVPRYHQVMCLVNSDKYGGAGGTIAVTSAHEDAPKIAIHEIGHSAFGLADEYGGDGTGTPSGEPAQANVTRNPNRATIKWSRFVAATTPMPSQCDGGCTGSRCRPPAAPPANGVIGAFEGAVYSNCNTYRPRVDCYMRTLGKPFCRICRREIAKVMLPFRPGARELARREALEAELLVPQAVQV